MTNTKGLLGKTGQYCLLALAAMALPMVAQAEHHETGGNVQVAGVTLEAEIFDIDLETREISVRGPDGSVMTMVAPEKLVKLEDLSVGDAIVTTYMAGLEGELREPTAEELAEPWLVVEETDVSDEGEQPAIGGARVVRAVCTIEGMNSELGTVTVKDSRGKLHLIGGVEPEKMQGVKLGQTIVMVYTQAMALTLEKKADMAAQ